MKPGLVLLLAGLLGPALTGPRLALAAPSGPGASEQNRERPPDASPDLAERAEHLFRAVTTDEPELADDFFFPREPFIPLKDVKDPARYHEELVRAFHRDVHRAHVSRRSWEGAKFVSFELGSPPRWVKPGEEWNKIGYHRTFNGRLRYELGGRTRTLEVHTIISWDGRWYVTHFLRTH